METLMPYFLNGGEANNSGFSFTLTDLAKQPHGDFTLWCWNPCSSRNLGAGNPNSDPDSFNLFQPSKSCFKFVKTFQNDPTWINGHSLNLSKKTINFDPIAPSSAQGCMPVVPWWPSRTSGAWSCALGSCRRSPRWRCRVFRWPFPPALEWRSRPTGRAVCFPRSSWALPLGVVGWGRSPKILWEKTPVMSELGRESLKSDGFQPYWSDSLNRIEQMCAHLGLGLDGSIRKLS